MLSFPQFFFHRGSKICHYVVSCLLYFQFYFEAQSRNKQLRTGSYFLYQVFPGNTVTWQRLFIKSAKEAEYETVEKMIMFFREDRSFINCKEPKSGNTALHFACKLGHFVSNSFLHFYNLLNCMYPGNITLLLSVFLA